MNFDTDERLIADALSEFERELPEADILSGVMKKLETRRPRRRVRYVVAAVIAAALLITGCAAALGAFDWLRGALNDGGFTDVVEPVEQSVTDQNIEFTAIAAQRYGDTGLVYVSVRDKSGESRLTDQTHVGFRVKDGGSLRISDIVYFDGATNTAVYTLNIELGPAAENDTVDLTMSYVDFSYDDQVMQLADLGVTITGFDDGPEIPKDSSAVMPAELGDKIPEMSGWCLGTVGKYDGQPFVQLVSELRGEVKMFRSPLAYIMSPDGTRYDADVGVMTMDENFEYDPFFPDYIVYTLLFDALPEDIEGGELYFGGRYSEEVYGDWAIDVELAERPLQLEYVVDIPVGDTVIEDVKVSLTPVSMTIEGVAPSVELAHAAMRATPVMEDDIDKHEYTTMSGTYESDDGVEFYFNRYYSSTIMPEEVIGLRIGDEVIYFAQQ